jgi:predicted PurR-regulated permease PerM
MLDKRTIDISTGIIFRTILILIGLWILYLVRGVIAILFVSLIMSAAIEPAVRWMTKKRIPRSFAVLIIFLVLFFVIGGLISLLVPSIASQLDDFTQNFPLHLEKLTQIFSGLEKYFALHGLELKTQDILNNISGKIAEYSGEIFSTTASIFSGFISLIVILSLTFYLSVKEEGMKNFITSVTPAVHQDYVVLLAERIRKRIGKWLQGQLFLMFIIFTLDLIALYLLGVPYALILAILAGMMEIIPYLGPIISAIPAVLVGFLVNPLTGLLVLAAYIIIQQFENHVITPQIMKKAIGLNPVAVILALLIGAKLGGVLGAIMAIPLTAAGSVFVKDLLAKKEQPIA